MLRAESGSFSVGHDEVEEVSEPVRNLLGLNSKIHIQYSLTVDIGSNFDSRLAHCQSKKYAPSLIHFPQGLCLSVSVSMTALFQVVGVDVNDDRSVFGVSLDDIRKYSFIIRI